MLVLWWFPTYLAFQQPVGSKLKVRVGLLNAPDNIVQTASCATDQLSCRMALKAPVARENVGAIATNDAYLAFQEPRVVIRKLH